MKDKILYWDRVRKLLDERSSEMKECRVMQAERCMGGCGMRWHIGCGKIIH